MVGTQEASPAVRPHGLHCGSCSVVLFGLSHRFRRVAPARAVYAPTPQGVAAFSSAGDVKWTVRLKDLPCGSVIIGRGGALYVADVKGRLYAIK